MKITASEVCRNAKNTFGTNCGCTQSMKLFY